MPRSCECQGEDALSHRLPLNSDCPDESFSGHLHSNTQLAFGQMSCSLHYILLFKILQVPGVTEKCVYVCVCVRACVWPWLAWNSLCRPTCLKLTKVHMAVTPQCWDWRCAPPHPADLGVYPTLCLLPDHLPQGKWSTKSFPVNEGGLPAQQPQWMAPLRAWDRNQPLTEKSSGKTGVLMSATASYGS